MPSSSLRVSALALLALLFSLVSVVRADAPTSTLTPQQLHLALAATPQQMQLSYVTLEPVSSSLVSWGSSATNLSSHALASTKRFTDGGAARVNRTMHTVTLTQLVPGTRYFYQVTVQSMNLSVKAVSSVFDFRTIDETQGVTSPLRVLIYGDYGLINGEQSHRQLDVQVQAHAADLIAHVGDQAYNLDDDNGNRGDLFMQREESVLAHLPYMVAVGNHEEAFNFSHYLNRFDLPNVAAKSPTNLYYSFNVGSVHWISVDTERYFFPEFYTIDHIRMQHEWLIQDLKSIDRSVTPWVVVYSHRPLYCTHIWHDYNAPYCTEEAHAVRYGVAASNGERQYGLEAPLLQYKVDLYACGHMHSYERTYPVRKGQTVNKSYKDNEAPWHLVVGAAGNQEYLDTYDEATAEDWSAARSDSYGIGKLTIFNHTHMLWEQLLDDGTVLDTVMTTKEATKNVHPQAKTVIASL